MNADACIFFQLAKAGQAGAEFWGTKVSPLGLTAVQALVLNFLREQDGTTAQHLGRRTKISSATMTGVLDRLVKRGLIARRDHPDDRRAILVSLTTQGTAIAKKIGRLFVEANLAFLADFNADEIATLRQLLDRMRQKRHDAPSEASHV